MTTNKQKTGQHDNKQTNKSTRQQTNKQVNHHHKTNLSPSLSWMIWSNSVLSLASFGRLDTGQRGREGGGVRGVSIPRTRLLVLSSSQMAANPGNPPESPGRQGGKRLTCTCTSIFPNNRPCPYNSPHAFSVHLILAGALQAHVCTYMYMYIYICIYILGRKR